MSSVYISGSITGFLAHGWLEEMRGEERNGNEGGGEKMKRGSISISLFGLTCNSSLFSLFLSPLLLSSSLLSSAFTSLNQTCH